MWCGLRPFYCLTKQMVCIEVLTTMPILQLSHFLLYTFTHFEMPFYCHQFSSIHKLIQIRSVFVSFFSFIFFFQFHWESNFYELDGKKSNVQWSNLKAVRFRWAVAVCFQFRCNSHISVSVERFRIRKVRIQEIKLFARPFFVLQPKRSINCIVAYCTQRFEMNTANI